MVRTFVILALCLSLAALLFGQERTAPLSPGGPPIQPGTTIPSTQTYVPAGGTIPLSAGAPPLTPNVPVPATGVIPPAGTTAPASIAPIPGSATRTTIIPFNGTTIPPPNGTFPQFPPAVAHHLRGEFVTPQMREHYAVASRVELDNGTILTGEIHSDSPLECTALYGPALIPWNQIKGIEWRNVSDEQGGQERKATLVLVNGDSLTVSNTITAIQLKTSWGESKVELAHVRSILMTVEKVKWIDAPDGRRVLVPDEGTPATEARPVGGFGT